MKKKFFVLRVLNKDLWFAHKGADLLTNKRNNIQVFTEKLSPTPSEVAKFMSEKHNLTIVAETW